MPFAPRMPREVRATSSASRVVELPDRDLLGAQSPFVLHTTEVVGQQPALLDLEGHVGELLLGELERRDRLPELHTLLRVVQGRLEARARGAHHAPDDAVSGLVQARERTLEPFDPWQHRARGKAHVVHHELARHARAKRHLLVDVGGAEPRRVARHDEAAHALVGIRPHDRYVAHAAVRDPHLRAGEHPVVAVAPGERAHRSRIAAGVGLAQTEASDRIAARHTRQPLRALLVAPMREDREHGQCALHGHERPQAGVTGFQLELDQSVGDRVQAEHALALQLHAEESHPPELLRELSGRELARLVPLLHLRQDPAAHPLLAVSRTARSSSLSRWSMSSRS